jgi:hypothetical protein
VHTSVPTGLSEKTASIPAPSVASASSAHNRPFWVWWHLLSLDAPTVAVVWCWFFGAVFQVKFPWVTLPTLALGTWCVYVADRLLDGWRGADMAALRDRHWFTLRHRQPFLLAWVMAAAPLAYFIFFRVAPQVRADDILLCGIGIAYFLLVHSGASSGVGLRRLSAWFPKELAVGFLFAIATAVPTAARIFSSARQQEHALLLSSTIFAFGAVCWLNCVAIQTWEDHERGSEVMHAILSGPQSNPETSGHGWTRFLGEHLAAFSGLVCALSLVAAAGTMENRAGLLFLAIALSAGAFLVLTRLSHRVSVLTLRIAADAALLTPLLFALALR